MATQQELLDLTHQYLIENYGPRKRAMVRGAGSRIWDADGNEYIDFFPGFGAAGVTGHCHPAVVGAIKTQAGTLLAHGNGYTNVPQVALAKMLAEKGFGGQSFFCHSGAEANEGALKLARLTAGEGRYKIISCHGCFHGRTMGALSLTPENYQKGFEPMLPGNVKVDYNDIDALTRAVDDETAGIILEPIQGEGGVNIPTVEYMQAVRALCDAHKIALIIDEVWTAPARTGKWFAYQHYGIEPDIMSLGKATGGGLPVAATVAKAALAEKMVGGTHGCTLGGNPVCAAAGLATMKLIEDDDLLTAAVDKGAKIVGAIESAGIGKVREVRGKGLFIGMQLDGPGADIAATCLERGLIINCTQESVLRLAPALTIPDTDIDAGLEILLDALKA